MKRFLFVLLIIISFSGFTYATNQQEQEKWNKICFDVFWANAYWAWVFDDSWLYTCECKDWYEFNLEKTKCIDARNLELWNAVCREMFWVYSYWDWKDYDSKKWYVCSCEKWAVWSDDSKSCVLVKTVKISDWNITLKEIPFVEDRVKDAMYILHDIYSSFNSMKRNAILNKHITNFEAKKKENLNTSDRIIVNKIVAWLVDLRDNWDTYKIWE